MGGVGGEGGEGGEGGGGLTNSKEEYGAVRSSTEVVCVVCLSDCQICRLLFELPIFSRGLETVVGECKGWGTV